VGRQQGGATGVHSCFFCRRRVWQGVQGAGRKLPCVRQDCARLSVCVKRPMQSCTE
jgi:hypothetical protein